MELHESQQRAIERMNDAVLGLSPAGRAAFFSGEVALDLGEGWTVLADRENNTFRWEHSYARAYEDELAAAPRQTASGGAQMSAGTITKDVQATVWERDRGRCVTCGDQEDLEFALVIPRARGGSFGAGNVQVKCQTCLALE